MNKRDKTEDEMPRAVALPGHGRGEPGLRSAAQDGPAGDVDTYTEDLDEDEAAAVAQELRSIQSRINPSRITRDG